MYNKYYISILIGGLGQLGTGLAKMLRQKYGKDNVIMSDILKPSKEVVEAGTNHITFQTIEWYNEINSLLFRTLHFCRHIGFQMPSRNDSYA